MYRPILFNTDMVKAILDGRKTVTRRCIKPQPINDPQVDPEDWKELLTFVSAPCHKGDILWVRETWCDDRQFTHDDTPGQYFYKASSDDDFDPKWRPSIHMPKEAARIFLKVTDVRVERLHDITEDETEREGFNFTPPCLHQVSEDSYCDLDGPCTSCIKYCDMSAGELFGNVLWNSTIKPSDFDTYGWDANPYVWVIEFERCEEPSTFY